MDVTSEGAELSRDVLSALAHELGGIASALDLRASAMARSIPENDLRALKDIAEEVRQVTKAARFARGQDGFGILNPSRVQSFDDWWRLASRFTASVLPRGVALETVFSKAELTATQAAALTWMWLAACKEITERGILTPASVELRGSPTGNGVALIATVNIDRVTPPENRVPSRWAKYASRVAADIDAGAPMWTEEPTLLRWRCDIPAPAT